MTVFYATVSFEGADGKQVKRKFDLGDFATGTPDGDYAAADNAITQITGALATITDAAIRKVLLTGVQSEDLVTAGAGNVFENALLNVYLDAGGVKVTQLYVPAPVIGIFLTATGPGRDKLDIADADVIQYVQQIAQHAFVSDGEQVDTTVSNGIDGGKRVVRDLKLV